MPRGIWLGLPLVLKAALAQMVLTARLGLPCCYKLVLGFILFCFLSSIQFFINFSLFSRCTSVELIYDILLSSQIIGLSFLFWMFQNDYPSPRVNLKNWATLPIRLFFSTFKCHDKALNMGKLGRSKPIQLLVILPKRIRFPFWDGWSTSFC